LARRIPDDPAVAASEGYFLLLPRIAVRL